MTAPPTRKLWFRPTITAKFLVLLFGFLALQLFQLGIGAYSVRRIEQQGALAATIHEQRLRTIQLGDSARKLQDPAGDTRAARNALAASAASYGQGLLQLQFLLSHDHAAATDLLGLAGEAMRSWDELLQPMLQQARTATSRAAKGEVLKRFDALSTAQVERLSRMLRLLEVNDRALARQLAWAQTAIVGLSLVLVALGALLMRHLVTRPLKRFFEVTRAMADGAYDRRVEVHTNDEIGDLARAFNRMAGAVEDKTARLHAFNEVALAVTSSLSLQEILAQITVFGMPLTGANGVCIALYDDATRSFAHWVTRGLSERYVATLAFPPGGLAERILRHDDYLLSSERSGDPFPLSAAEREEGIRSVIGLPLVSDAHRLGVIYFYRGEGPKFSFEDIELIRTFSHLAARSIQNARVHEHTVDLAETDALTGLYNRRKLEQRLREEVQRAQRSNRPLALLLLDVDYFKRVNDSHGHAAGDAVLQALAQAFRREVRDVDLVARAGGEEFLFLLPETDAARAQRVAERIRQAVAALTIRVGGVTLQVTASVGVAGYPIDAGNVETLMVNADRALYVAKQEGRNRVQMFRESTLH